ncbi:hypothetical protein J1N35_034920 [Gossypium stocksii]|uniref:Uncharacterized protein n=1 Tax=Gossypium stocksii TaxID=47602 RepID=A0A9D3UTG7_9ROSI|nr:hypothetical protein J1N35_034920 [Gossypium stocksii]
MDYVYAIGILFVTFYHRSANFVDSSIHTADPPTTIFMLETIHQNQPEAPLGSLLINTPSGEVGIVFPWQDLLRSGKYPFSLDAI